MEDTERRPSGTPRRANIRRCRHSIRMEDTERPRTVPANSPNPIVADTRSEWRILKEALLDAPNPHTMSCRHSIRMEDTERLGGERGYGWGQVEVADTRSEWRILKALTGTSPRNSRHRVADTRSEWRILKVSMSSSREMVSVTLQTLDPNGGY